MDMTAHTPDPIDGTAADGPDVDLKIQSSPKTGAATACTTASGLTVRPLEPGDFEAWRTLFRAHGRFYDVDIDEATLETTWAWIHDPRQTVYGQVAASPDGTIVGIVHYQAMPRTMRNKRSGSGSGKPSSLST